MFLKITTKKYKGNVHRHASIVETIREGRKIRQKLVRNLGVLKTNEDEKKAKRLIVKYKEGNVLVSLNETNEKCFDYGVLLLVRHLWKELKLDNFFSVAKKYDYNELISLLIAHRLHNYGSCNLSEREAYRWIREEAYTSQTELELHQLYRTLKKLYAKKDSIEKHLFSKCEENSIAVLYDLTSTYVEGSYKKSELVDFGYNRDKKKGKEQIVIGLLLKDNLPIAHKVWKGNTADKSTLREAIAQTKKLGIKKFIFIADRGIFTEKNLDFVDEENLEYIIATRRRNDDFLKELMQQETKEQVRKVHEQIVKEHKRIYYLCFNEEVAKVQKEELQQIKEWAETKLKHMKKPSERSVYTKLGKVARLFKISFKPFSFLLDENVWKYEQAIAGKYLLVTNNDALVAQEVVKTYKQLAEIERAFGELKHLENMRPVFHKKDAGILAHIFLCVLTLFLERYVMQSIKDKTAREVIEEMKKLRVSKTGTHYVRTDITKEQKDILEKIGLLEPPKVIV